MSRWCCLLLALTTGAAGAAATASVPSPLLSPEGAADARPIYVDFWASWCVPCAQSFPWLNTVQSRYGEALRIVAVNVDEDARAAERFLRRYPADFAVVYDPAGELARHYAVQGMPSALLLSPAGEVLWQHVGFRTQDIPAYEAAIAEALP